MNFNTAHFYESFLYGIKYFPNTLRLVFIPLAIGLTLGTVIALARVYKVPVLCKLLGIFVTVSIMWSA